MNTNKNHYARQVAQLDALLRSKAHQLELMQKENQLLLHKEKALINAIRGIEGSLSAVSKEELVQTANLQHSRRQTPTDSGVSAGATRQHQVQDTEPGNSQGGNNVSATSGGCSGEATSRTDSSQQASSSGQDPADTVNTTSAMRRQMDAKEDQVQHMLQQLGCCDKAGYTQLYSTWLLQKAMQDPARVVTLLSWTHPERLTYLCKIVAQMALLICKYDADIICPTSGSPRDQLDALVDELFELVIIYGLWEPPSRYFSNLMVNMDTKEFEPYPDGFWKQVVEAIEMSPDQRAALKLTWERVKSSTDQVTRQCEQLQEQLQQMHAQQLMHNRQFEAGIKSSQERVQQLQEQRRQQQRQQSVLQHTQQQQEQAAAAAGSASSVQQPLLQQNLQRLQQLLLQKVQQRPSQGEHGAALQPEPPQLQHGQLSASEQQQPRQEQQQAQWLQQQHVLQQQQQVFQQQPRQEQQQHAQLLQQQQVFQQQQWATAQLHAEWQAEGCIDSAVGLDDVDMLPAADLAAMDQMMQELAAELLIEQQREQQLQQEFQELLLQQQQGRGSVVHATVPAGGVADTAMNMPAVGHHVGSETSRTAAKLAQAAAAAPAAPPEDVAAANGTDRAAGVCNRASVMFSWHNQELREAEEVLLQEGTEERRLLERRIQACTDGIKVLFFCQVLQFTNTLSKLQLATLFVHAHPFVPDVVTMCEAMDEMGWDDA